MANILDELGSTFSGAEDYTPKNLTQKQIGQESGGKQFDASGKPLRSSKGATGIAQIMPATGPEAAELAGLPWDPKKFEHDADYNMQLGDAYQGMLNKKYGDKTIAKAAYNAGPGRVDKALMMAKDKGGHWTHYIPQETRDYIGMSGQRVPQKGDVRTVDVPPSRYVGQAVGAPQDRSAPIQDTSDIAPTIKGQAATVLDRSNTLGSVLDQVSSGLKTNMEQQTKTMEQSVAAKEVIRTEQEARVTQVKETLFPIFAKRRAIAERQEEVSQMDPISRAVAGVFNPNYNRKHLQQQDHLLENQQNILATEFNQTNAVQEKLMEVMSERYSDQSSIQALAAKNLAGTLALAQDSLSVAQTQMGASLGTIQANSQVVAAQMQQRESVLGELMDTQSVDNLLAQSKTSKEGNVMVGGVTLSGADLQKRGLQIERMDMEFKNQKLAIQEGDLRLQKLADERIVDMMTPVERQKAAQNNGILANGQKVSMDALVPALQQDAIVSQQVVDGITNQSIGNSSRQVMQQWSQEFKGLTSRAQAVLGVRSTDSIARSGVAQANRVDQLTSQISRMPEGPARDTMKAQLAVEVNKFTQSNRDAVEQLVVKASPDVAVQGLYRSWVTGQPLTPDAAVNGFVNAVRTGVSLPGSTNRADPAYATVNAMQDAVLNVYKMNGGEAGVRARLGNKATAAEMKLKLTQAVANASKTWVSESMGKFYNSIPHWAAADKHPAAKIQPGMISRAEAMGDERGLQLGSAVAQEVLGVVLSPEQINEVLKGGPLAGKFDAGKLRRFGSKISTLQTQEMMRVLDSNWTTDQGPRPSQMLADYMGSPGFQGRIKAYEQNIGRNSLPTMVATSVAGPGVLSSAASAFGRNFATAAASNEDADFHSALTTYKTYRSDPFKRTGAILGSIEGLDPHSEQVVLQFIKSQVESGKGMSTGMRLTNAASNPGALLGIESAQDDPTYSKEILPLIDNLIMNQKWSQDLEPLRKKIAPLWTQHGRMVDSAVDRLEK